MSPCVGIRRSTLIVGHEVVDLHLIAEKASTLNFHWKRKRMDLLMGGLGAPLWYDSHQGDVTWAVILHGGSLHP